MLMTNSNFSYDEMKRVVNDVIKAGHFQQYANIESAVVDSLEKQGVIKESSSWSTGHSQGFKDISEPDGVMVNQIVWDLILERVITIGFNKSNNAWPFLRLTEFGKNSFENDIPLHDIDGILSSLKQRIPNIDDVILLYLSECLQTYRVNTLLSSTVMLGCATEKAILLLIESYICWLGENGEEKEKNKFIDMGNRSIAKQFDEFTKSLKSHKGSINHEVFDDFDVIINSIFTIIRKNRNDAGHPTGRIIDRPELSAWIHVFRIHCEKIYALKNYFDS